MKLLIDISEYNAEYIKNAYGIPQDINTAIAEAIINGKQVPTPHGRLIDADAIQDYNVETFGQRLLIIDTAPTVIEAEE